MKAWVPERGSSTPTLSLFVWARTMAGAASTVEPATALPAARRLKSRRVSRVMSVSSSLSTRSGSAVRTASGLPRLVSQDALQDLAGGALRQFIDDIDAR